MSRRACLARLQIASATAQKSHLLLQFRGGKRLGQARAPAQCFRQRPIAVTAGQDEGDVALEQLFGNGKYVSTANANIQDGGVDGGGAQAENGLTLVWKETGGPAVKTPSRTGFGTTLIERTLSHDLDGDVNREFLASGLRCTIKIPLTSDVGHLAGFGGKGGKA